MKRNKLTLLVSIMSLSMFVFVCYGCSSNEKDNTSMFEQWATTTYETVDYYSYYKCPVEVLTDSNKQDYLSLITVKDSNGNDVAVVSDKFLVEDMDGYTVTYEIAVNEVLYSKVINLSVEIANPNFFIGTHKEYNVGGATCELPQILVKENDGTPIDYSVILYDTQNREVEVKNGKFVTGDTAGDYKLEIKTTGKNLRDVTQVVMLPVVNITKGVDYELRAYTEENTWYNVDGAEKQSLPSYGTYNGYKGSSGVLEMKVDLGMSLSQIKNNFGTLKFNMIYEGDGSHTVSCKASTAGENAKVYTAVTGEFTNVLNFWGSCDVYVSTDEFNGSLYFESDVEGNGGFYVSLTSATAISKELVVESDVSEIPINKEFTLPTAKYFENKVENKNVAVTTTVKFNGEAIALKDKYTFADDGVLEITYSANGLTESVTYNVKSKITLISLNDTDYLTCSDGTATIGNNIPLGDNGEVFWPAMYGAREVIGSNKLNVDINVGDVSEYPTIIVTMWVLGRLGDSWTLDIGGQQVSGLGWRDYTNPLVVTIPTWTIIDNKVNVLLNTTNTFGSAIYVISVEGDIKGSDTELVSSSLPNEVLIGDTITSECSATVKVKGEEAGQVKLSKLFFNGEEVALPYTAIEKGTLTYVFSDGNKEYEHTANIVNYINYIVDGRITSDSDYETINIISGIASKGKDETFGRYGVINMKDSVTIEYDLGELPDCETVRFEFWMYNLMGATSTFTFGSIVKTGAWIVYDGPIIVEVDRNSIVNNKITVTYDALSPTGDTLLLIFVKCTNNGLFVD